MREQFYLTVGKRDLVGGSLRLLDTGISGTAILGARHKHLASRRRRRLLLLQVAPIFFSFFCARVFPLAMAKSSSFLSFFEQR
jgi:hypothetical protein